MIRLTVQIPGDPSRTFQFDSGKPIGVGRSPGNGVHIPVGRVSGLHGEISHTTDGWRYRDLKSTNGSMRLREGQRDVVDGESSPMVTLEHGDILLLGDADDPVVLQVEIVEQAQPSRAEGTVVARRAMDLADLSGVLFGATPPDLVQLLTTVAGETSPEGVFGHIAGYFLSAIPGAASVGLAMAAGEDSLLLRPNAAVEVVDSDAAPWPRGLVAQVLDGSETLLATDDSTVSAELSLARLGTTSAIVVPVRAERQRPIGALVINGQDPGLRLQDLDLAAALTAQVATSFGTARLVRRLQAVERRLREENRFLKTQVETRKGAFADIIGDSPALKRVFEEITLVMDTDATVLINGETGTGKELVARALHDKSQRRSRLFAAVNCAALSPNLLESELFGHMKGAFTGAVENKKGLFQVADGGTLFLDELGELDTALQAKLLRVLQEGEVTPVGSTRPIQVNVRIVAATHRDLRQMAREGTFREDLFYRINVFPIRLPPLRERGKDILQLAEFFLGRYGERFSKRVAGLSEDAAGRLTSYAWPGNIRELQNEMQRAVLLTPEAGLVQTRALSEDLRSGDATGPAAPSTAGGVGYRMVGTLKQTMEAIEREVLRLELEEQGWNRSQAARDMGLSRQALMAKLSKYDLAPE